MEEIKVGEYVRTKTGKIRKLKSTVAQYYITDRLNINDNNQFTIENIVKYSPNIIDLIEVGDYVNGYKVIFNLDKSKKIYDTTDNFITCVDYTFDEDEIKSIVTKEQFENISYKVEE